MTDLNTAVLAAPNSTLTQIQDLASNTINWMGRQIVWLGSTLKDYMKKVVDFVKPFFANVLKFSSQYFEKVREFVIANKEVVGVGAVTLFLGILVALGFGQLCGGNPQQQPNHLTPST